MNITGCVPFGFIPSSWIANQYDEVTCPMAQVEWVYGEDGTDESLHPEVGACGEPLVLLIEGMVPLTTDMPVVKISEAGEWFCTSAWRVECHAGHVLARSSADESAEDFDPLVVLGIPRVAGPS